MFMSAPLHLGVSIEKEKNVGLPNSTNLLAETDRPRNNAATTCFAYSGQPLKA
jgi:hypothetical protein